MRQSVSARFRRWKDANERGIAEAERIRELDPEFADQDIALLYWGLGRPEDAAREWLAWLAGGGAALDPLREAFQNGSDEGGLQGGLRAMRDSAIEAATRGAFGLESHIAYLSGMIGETEEAMTWFERVYRQRDPLMSILKVHPICDPLRSDPRFQDLLRRIGFPES